MPFQTALPVAETEVGIAIESTRGTYVAPAFWLPVMGPKYKPDVTYMPDQTLQGSMVSIYDEVPGLRVDTHGWDSYPYMDTFPVLIRALLGSADTLTAAPSNTTLAASAAVGATTISTTATIATNSWIVIDSGVGVMETHRTTNVSGTGPFTVTLDYPLYFAHNNGASVTGLTRHQFSLLNNAQASGNQPPSVSIVDYAGDAWRALTAAQLDQIMLQGSADTLPKYTCNWFSHLSITPSTPTPSFSSVEAPPGWTSTLALGGTLVPYVMSWEFDFKRNVKPIPAITGTLNYYQLFAGVLDATAKITVLQDSSSTWLSAYQNGATDSVDFTLYDVKSGYAMRIHSTLAKFITGQIDRSKEWVEIPLELQLLPSSTDALAGGVSPVMIEFGNALTAQY